MATTFVERTGDGNATKQFSFPSIQESDIKVKVDEVLKSSGTHYNITGYTTTGGGNVVFTSGNIPTSPSVILIYRDTNVDSAKATYTAGASVKAGDLNANHEQVLFALQEEQNQLERISDIEDGSIDSAKIKNDTIVNIDVNSAAAIDGTKISPDFGSQNIATTGNITVSGTVDGRDVSVDGVKLDTIETNAKDDQTAAEIRTLVEAATDSNVFTDADHTKLNGIETAATADQTDAEIRTAVENATDSNVFTDADHTKLDGIETGATADQTAAEIRTLVESATDSNVFTDADHTKLNSLGTLNALSDVNTAGVSNDKILKYDSSVSQFIIADASSGELGSTTFTGLNDTPVNFGSAAGKVIKVNSGETALEFADADVVADTTPQLGGNLDVQANEITTSTTNGNIKLTPDGTGKVEVKGNTNAGSIQLNCENNSHGVTLKGPAHSAGASYTLTLPTGISNDKPLVSDASGNLSWANDFVTTNGASFTGSIGAFGGIVLGSNDTIKFDSDDQDTNHISFKGPTSLSSTVTYTLPEDGSAGHVLKTDGSGVLSFGVYNIINDTTPQLGGSLNTGGHDINFLTDGDKASFGLHGDLEIYHSGQHSVIRTTTGSTGNLNIRSDNDILIGTLTDGNNFITCTEGAQVELHHNYSKKLETTSTGVSVTGGLVASGDVTAFSDAKLKTDIHTINNALGIVGQLRGVSYKWLKDGKPSIGVIAQEVEEVIPEVVHTTDYEGKEVKSVDYGKMVGVLINAINELKAEVEELKNAKITG